jgi:NAD(P)-dependent dehydrogenase (short-subunit alcohol dehydrogenase family)
MPADRAPSVIITGIHSDLGFAISYVFRSEGWFVIGTDHGTTTGRNARVHISADLTNEDDCRALAKRAAKLGNGIDCIVHLSEVHMDGPVDEVGSRAWDVMMDVNAKSAFLLAKAAMPYLTELHGTIVTVPPAPGDNAQSAVFDATRAALIALMDSLRSELAPRGIHVQVVDAVRDGVRLDPKVVANEIWTMASPDEEGHVRSFAHAH